METVEHLQSNTGHACHVLTVPMRNGNLETKTPLGIVAQRSYRTYEEWKPVFDHFSNICCFSFLPYL